MIEQNTEKEMIEEIKRLKSENKELKINFNSIKKELKFMRIQYNVLFILIILIIIYIMNTLGLGL